MPAPTTSWFCDTCGQLIETADRGWVELIKTDPNPSGFQEGREIRIVHYRANCQFGNQPGYSLGDDSLTSFLGVDGLMQLLMMLAESEFPVPVLLETIKRIHIPGYEHARWHFQRALAAGVITNDVLSGYWWQEDIQRVLNFAAREEGFANERD